MMFWWRHLPQMSCTILLKRVLMKARKDSINFSRKKFALGQESIFGGYLIKFYKQRQKLVVLPDLHKIEALSQINTPIERPELLSFLGLTKKFWKWSPKLSFKTTELRKLITKFNWLPAHQKEFKDIKKIVSDPARLEPFSQRRKTDLFTDGLKLH